MSVFLAIDLDDATRATVSQLMQTHRGAYPAKWLREDKLHCTLVFLGNPTPEQVEAWKAPIDALAGRHRGFALSLRGAGSFVTARAPSVLWLGVVGAVAELAALQRDAHETLGSAAGHGEREYLPHVTLARAQGEEHFEGLLPELQRFEGAPFRVGHVSLYESNNHVYRVLHQARLGG